MKRQGTGPSGRTAAERAAIDRRCDAWVRPLSATQRRALAEMAKGKLMKWRAGFGLSTATITFYPTRTIVALAERGFARLEHHNTTAAITPAGRRELKRYR